jgi:hypothetical protein
MVLAKFNFLLIYRKNIKQQKQLVLIYSTVFFIDILKKDTIKNEF